MSAEVGFFFSGAWLLELGAGDLRSLGRRLEADREEIPEGRYRLRCFPAGIQIVGERPGRTVPLPLLQAVVGELRCELKLLWTARVNHRGSEFFELQYEHWRGQACLRRLATGPVLGDSIGWVGVDGVPEPWEAAAFARSPQRGQATFGIGWPRVFEAVSSPSGPVPPGSGTPLAEAEIIGARPRGTVG